MHNYVHKIEDNSQYYSGDMNNEFVTMLYIICVP